MLTIPAFSCSGLGRIMRLLEVFNEQTGKERRELRWGSCQGSRHPPKSQVPSWKLFAWLILPKVCFSAPGWFVVSGWFCHLLPEMHLIFVSFQRWCSPKETHYCPSSICSRNVCGLDWHAGWLLVPLSPLPSENPHVNGYSQKPFAMWGLRVSSQPGLCVVAWAFFPFINSLLSFLVYGPFYLIYSYSVLFLFGSFFLFLFLPTFSWEIYWNNLFMH